MEEGEAAGDTSWAAGLQCVWSERVQNIYSTHLTEVHTHNHAYLSCQVSSFVCRLVLLPIYA